MSDVERKSYSVDELSVSPVRKSIRKSAATKSRSRGWCWTLNNPSREERDSVLVDTMRAGAKYTLYGVEVGDQGTEHLQGYTYFKNARSFSSVRRLLPRAHIEAQKGTCQQAMEYCQKDGQFFFLGIPPVSQGEKGYLPFYMSDDF